ncbi:MAG: hypothetical protein VW378_01845 [bacterium]
MPVTLLLLSITFLLSVIAIYMLINICHKKSILSLPNERSAHKKPTPAIGGLGFILVFYFMTIVCWQFYFKDELIFLKIMSLCFPIALLGLWDDFKELSAIKRLFIQALVALSAFFWGFRVTIIELPFLTLDFNIISIVSTSLFIISLCNFFNFIDGLDGYLGGITIIGLGFLSIFFLIADQFSGFFLCTLLVATLMGFMLWNYPKAKIFMGDVGSCFLGCFIALMAIQCDMNQQLSLVIPMILFATIILDCTFTLGIRLFNKKKIWEGHREHFFQKLFVILGSQKHVLYVGYLLTLCHGIAAMFYFKSSKEIRLSILLVVILLNLCKYIWIHFIFKKCQIQQKTTT